MIIKIMINIKLYLLFLKVW